MPTTDENRKGRKKKPVDDEIDSRSGLFLSLDIIYAFF